MVSLNACGPCPFCNPNHTNKDWGSSTCSYCTGFEGAKPGHILPNHPTASLVMMLPRGHSVA